MFKQTPIPAKVTFYTISRAFVSCLGCQHFISDWLGKLKPNKLSTGCQNELKGAAVEKATNPGRRFLFFSRLRRSCARLNKTAMLRRLWFVPLENPRTNGNSEKVVPFSRLGRTTFRIEIRLPFTLGIDIHDMVIRYGEALWPGTSPRPGESKNGDYQPPTYPRGGRLGRRPLRFRDLE